MKGPAVDAKLPPQDVLPFSPTLSASIAGCTMRESIYKRRVEPHRLPADAPNILTVLIADTGSPVWDKYQPPFKFTGTLYSATVDVNGELIKDDEHALKVVMARQ